MYVSRTILGLAAGMLAALAVQAQAPAGAPAGSTGQCKDGSYYSGATKQGACRGHKGVKDWYGASTAAAPAAPAATPVATSRSSKKKAAAAAAPAAVTSGPAPSGSTGQCNDGSYYSGASKKGACRGHKGVKDWYGAAPAAAAPAAAAAAPVAPVAPAAPAPRTPAAAAPAAAAAPVAAAPGGGAGLVWVNTKSKVYHCQSDSMYGRTKEGSYMAEAAATAAGNRPARGKACH